MGISEDMKMVAVGAVFIIAASVDFLRRQFLKRRFSSPVGPAADNPIPAQGPTPKAGELDSRGEVQSTGVAT